jgi:hypothetical protein
MKSTLLGGPELKKQQTVKEIREELPEMTEESDMQELPTTNIDEQNDDKMKSSNTEEELANYINKEI